MERIAIKNISEEPSVIDCIRFDKTEISVNLKKVNGFHFVYILGYRGNPVYVGRSSSLWSRLSDHKYVFKNFDDITAIELKDKKSAMQLEKRLIKCLKPKNNFQYLHQHPYR